MFSDTLSVVACTLLPDVISDTFSEPEVLSIIDVLCAALLSLPQSLSESVCKEQASTHR